MRGNHVLKVVAHASPPLSSQPGFRQYDFFVNGQSFFSFPKVFRLGLAPNDPRGAPGGIPPAAYSGGGGYADAVPSSRSYSQRSRSDNIASIEAPKDLEEVRFSHAEQSRLSTCILIRYNIGIVTCRKMHTSKRQSKILCKSRGLAADLQALPSRMVRPTCSISLTRHLPRHLFRKFCSSFPLCTITDVNYVCTHRLIS